MAIIYHYNKSMNESFEAAEPNKPERRVGGYDDVIEEPFSTSELGGPRASVEEDISSSMAPLETSFPTGAGDNLSAARGGAFKPEDLLPKLGNSREEQQFAQLHPAGQGDVQGVNFLDAGSLIGQTTSLKRNANHQLRSDPPIEKKNVSPWMMSTITPDTVRKGLEIGSW